MTPKTSARQNSQPSTAKLRLATWTLLIAVSLTVSAGCLKPRVIAIPADKIVSRIEPGESYTATNHAVWIVPDARMQEILTELENK
jgi:hypothetical protein